MTTVDPLPLVVNLGGAWEIVEEPAHTLNLTGDASFEITPNLQHFSLGAEYWYKDQVALRAGYLFNSQDQGFSCGAGVQIFSFQLDYAFQPYNILGQVHRFSGIFRWDGPWVAGGEPNAPRYVNVKQSSQYLEIRWEKARGPVDKYEVLIDSMNGKGPFVSQPVLNPPYRIKNFALETLYKIQVRSIGYGGKRSFPSNEVYIWTKKEGSVAGPVAETVAVTGAGAGAGTGAKTVTGAGAGTGAKTGKGAGAGTGATVSGAAKGSFSRAQGVNGVVDVVGLQLYWTPPTDIPVIGYNLYRISPSGQVRRITLIAKKSTRVWVTDVSGLQGWQWVVTDVGTDGKDKKVVGTYFWYPTPEDMALLKKSPAIRLQATPRVGHKVTLAWDADPYAAKYSLLCDSQPDGIYEYFGDVKAGGNAKVVTSTLAIMSKQNRYYFIVIPKDINGAWRKGSNPTQVDFAVVNNR